DERAHLGAYQHAMTDQEQADSAVEFIGISSLADEVAQLRVKKVLQQVVLARAECAGQLSGLPGGYPSFGVDQDDIGVGTLRRLESFNAPFPNRAASELHHEMR